MVTLNKSWDCHLPIWAVQGTETTGKEGYYDWCDGSQVTMGRLVATMQLQQGQIGLEFNRWVTQCCQTIGVNNQPAVIL